MNTIFISYCSRDQAAAEEMLQRLKQWGYVDPFLSADSDTGILVGRDWMAELLAALKRSKALVFLCSEHSMQSPWCLAELVEAHANSKHIAPVKIAPYDPAHTLAPLQKLIDERQIADLTNGLDGYERLRKSLLEDGLDPTDEFPWDAHREPYPGMLAFEEADAAIYFGRDDEIADLLHRLGLMRLRDTPLTVVLGESGSGKSSFVRAGILPRLRKDRDAWLIVPPFRPKDAPIDELARALSDGLASHGQTVDWKEIRRRLAAATPDAVAALVDLSRDLVSAAGHREASALLVIDQLEEILSPGREQEAERFLQLLRGALERAGNPVLVLTTLRSDFFAAFQHRLDGLACDPFPLANLPAERVAAIVEGPAERIGFQVEDHLVDLVLDDMKGSDDALPLVAFTLRELYERCSARKCLTVGAYQDMGGLKGAVASRLAATVHFDQLSADEQSALRHTFLDQLSTFSGDGHRLSRRPCAWEATPVAARPLLDALVKARLLVRSADPSGQAMIEVAHEALFRTWNILVQWVKEDREFLQWRQRFEVRLDTWRKSDRSPDELLRGRELKRARRYRAARAERFDDAETEFIGRCVRANRLRLARMAAPLLLIVALGLGGAHLVQGVLRAQHLTATAEEILADRPLESVRLSAAALARWRTDGSWRTLRTALRQSHQRVLLPPPGQALGPGAKMQFAAFGADDQTIVTASTDNTARVWTIDWLALDPIHPRPGGAGGAPVQLALAPIPAPQVTRAALSPDGTRLVTVSGSVVSAWDAKTGKPVGSPLEHNAPVVTAVFGCDATQVLTADTQGMARLWNPESGAVVLLYGHLQELHAAAFSPDCTRVATASEDRTARVWDRVTGSLLALLNGHEAGVWSARFSPDGRRVVTASADKTARIWDPESQHSLGTLAHDAALFDARFSPDGERLATVGANGGVRLWNVTTREYQDLPGHDGRVTGLDFSPRGQWLVTAGEHGIARLWSATTGEPIARLRGHTGTINAVAFSPHGTRIVTAGNDGTARVWAVGADEAALVEVEPAGVEPYGALFAPDGESFVTVGADGAAFVWLTGAHEPSARLTGHVGNVRDAAFSTTGTFLITAGEGCGAHVWQLEDGVWSEATPPIEPGETLLSAAISADGRAVATASDAHPAQLWTRDQMSPAWRQVTAVTLPVAAGVAFSPDDRLLAAASGRAAVVWDLQTRQEAVRFEGHTDTVNSVAFNPRGDQIVTASADKTARIWDLPARQLVQVLPHEDPVQRATFSADGAWVVTASKEKARVWNARSGALISPVAVLADGVVHSAAFSSNGQLLITAAGDKKVKLFQWEEFAPRAALLGEIERRGIPPLTRAELDWYFGQQESAAAQYFGSLFNRTP